MRSSMKTPRKNRHGSSFGTPISPARILSDRLRELKINPRGLPATVSSHLRELVEAEASKIRAETARRIAKLEEEANQKARKAIFRAVTCRSIGKAFLKATPTVKGGDAK